MPQGTLNQQDWRHMPSDLERDSKAWQQWYAAHREQRREYNRSYHARNREKLIAKMRVNREARRQDRGIARRGSPEYHEGRVQSGLQAGAVHHARFLERHSGHEIIDGRCESCRRTSHMLAHLRHRACALDLSCTLSMADVEQLVAMVGQPCPLCDIIMVSRGNGDWSPEALSIDRVDNTRGYETGNVWALCWKCNARKRDASLPWLRRLVTAMERQNTLTLTKVG